MWRRQKGTSIWKLGCDKKTTQRVPNTSFCNISFLEFKTKLVWIRQFQCFTFSQAKPTQSLCYLRFYNWILLRLHYFFRLLSYFQHYSRKSLHIIVRWIVYHLTKHWIQNHSPTRVSPVLKPKINKERTNLKGKKKSCTTTSLAIANSPIKRAPGTMRGDNTQRLNKKGIKKHSPAASAMGYSPKR